MSSLPITIYEYIKMDHRKVDHLFKQFEESNIQERKQEIVAMIIQELLVHAHSEEDTFYKVLEKHYESEEEALHGEEEHKEIEAEIKVIVESKTFDAAWEKKVQKLKRLVEHHVKEEEGMIFTKAKKVISDEQALALKEQMHHLKGQLLAEMKE